MILVSKSDFFQHFGKDSILFNEAGPAPQPSSFDGPLVGTPHSWPRGWRSGASVSRKCKVIMIINARAENANAIKYETNTCVYIHTSMSISLFLFVESAS